MGEWAGDRGSSVDGVGDVGVCVVMEGEMEIRVGRKYRTRGGEEVVLRRNTNSYRDVYPFCTREGDDFRSYTEEGRYWEEAWKVDYRDLVEEVSVVDWDGELELVGWSGKGYDSYGEEVKGVVVRDRGETQARNRYLVCDAVTGRVLNDTGGYWECVRNKENAKEPRWEKGWKLLGTGRVSWAATPEVSYPVGVEVTPQEGCGPLAVFERKEDARAVSSYGGIVPCMFVRSKEEALWDRDGDRRELRDCPEGTVLADKVVCMA